MGATTLIVTIFLLLLGLDRGGNIGWDDAIARFSLSGFAVFATAFAFVELKWAKEPFAPQRIIVNRALIASYLVNLFCIASSFALLFHIPLFLQAVLGHTASQASLWLIFAVIGSVFGSLGGGLVMQATGKYYWLTFTAYLVFVIGTLSVSLSAGLVVVSTLGIGLGKAVSMAAPHLNKDLECFFGQASLSQA